VDEDRKQRRFARGGSTITQQLAKNLFFGTQKTLTRKLRELVVAWWMERDLSKRRILELYLNVIEWGDGIYGCEAAAATLVRKGRGRPGRAGGRGPGAMIPNPRRINPRVDPARFARARRRVLWLMGTRGSGRGQADRLGASRAAVEVEPEEEEETAPRAGAGADAEPQSGPTERAEPVETRRAGRERPGRR
jgi:monofunctional biosynthetic peptidoglycan transglycosylase